MKAHLVKPGEIQHVDDPCDAPVEVTFFVPCYNEEENIVQALETLRGTIAETAVTAEILVFDDHSADDTVQTVKSYQSEHPDVPIVLIENPRNKGLGYNFIEGSFRGQGKYYILLNGDNGQHQEDLVAILAERGKADMVISYFAENDNRVGGRRWLSRFFTSIINIASGHKVRYYNGPALHLRYNVIRWHPDTHGFAYQVEIITLLLDLGATCVEVKVMNHDRESGLSKAFTLKNFLSVSHSLLQIILRRIRRTIFGV